MAIQIYIFKIIVSNCIVKYRSRYPNNPCTYKVLKKHVSVKYEASRAKGIVAMTNVLKGME